MLGCVPCASPCSVVSDRRWNTRGGEFRLANLLSLRQVSWTKNRESLDYFLHVNFGHEASREEKQEQSFLNPGKLK